LATIGEALILSPDDARSLLIRAEAYRLLRKDELADADLTTLLRSTPAAIDARASRCYVRTALNRCDDAIADCDAALAGPSLAPAVRHQVLSQRAFCHAVRNHWADALSDLTAAEALRPLDAWALELRGEAEQHLDHFAAAATAYEHAIAVQPRPELWLDLALMRNRLGSYDAARAAVDKGLALKPRWPLALRIRADIASRAGSVEDAIADLDRALEIAPTDWEALNNRAWYKRRVGRSVEALRDIERAIAIKPDASVPYGTRCWVEVDLGRRAAALADCGRSIAKAKPSEEQADRGMLRFLQGDAAGADAEWAAWLQRPGAAPRSELAPYLDEVHRRMTVRR
jgi:tetratricopeptide (TPR) repeat protein